LKLLGNRYQLIVSDNGIEFPEELDFKNTESLGLQLVNNITGQLDGEIDLDRSNGTKVTINFEDLESIDWIWTHLLFFAYFKFFGLDTQFEIKYQTYTKIQNSSNKSKIDIKIKTWVSASNFYEIKLLNPITYFFRIKILWIFNRS